nr:immunoglobulin light chain junction region [Macaca mulatta]
CYQYYRGSTF